MLTIDFLTKALETAKETATDRQHLRMSLDYLRTVIFLANGLGAINSIEANKLHSDITSAYKDKGTS